MSEQVPHEKRGGAAANGGVDHGLAPEGGARVWALCTVLLGLATAVLIYQAYHRLGGHWSYPLDDTYIHMALARNLALYHTWGINPGTFAAASSSPLYTLLLALLFKVFGVNILLPLVVNILAALVLLGVLQRALGREGISRTAQVLILVAVLILTPLPTLVISGMEHTLQCLFAFLFIWSFASWAEQHTGDLSGLGGRAGHGERRNISWPVLIYAALMVATRYECLFLVAVAGLILLARRHVTEALLLGVFGLLPVILFGLYSVHKGSYFLPNSILLKSATGQGLSAFVQGIFADKLSLSKQGITGTATQRLLLILPLVFLVFRKFFATAPRYTYILVLITGATLLHLCLASTGWLYRYEAYLVLNATMITGVLLARYGRKAWAPAPGLNKFAIVFLGGYLLLPLGLRSSAAFSKTSRASMNIYEQQSQMARFLRLAYPHSAVAANDIGAISLLGDVHTLDLWGLGNIDVARAKRGHYWTPVFLDSLSRREQVQVAVIYDSWFDPALLARWTKVGTWTIPDNVICGDATVSFYTPDSAGAAELKMRLNAFAPSLPSEVVVHYAPFLPAAPPSNNMLYP
jgi:hypothetical protein